MERISKGLSHEETAYWESYFDGSPEVTQEEKEDQLELLIESYLFND